MEQSAEATPGRHGQVVLVYNPLSGHSHALEDLYAALETAGLVVGEQLLIGELDKLRPQGQEWRRRGFHAAVAAGGDGTIGAVATQLAGSDLPLGILPLGTSNDSARSLGIPLELADACAVLAHGLPVVVDAAEALPALTQPGALARRRARNQPAPGGAIFFHALTMGANVEFAKLATDLARRQRWGPLNYPTALLEALLQLRSIPTTLRFSGLQAEPPAQAELRCQALQICVVNTPHFGGPLQLRLSDVELHDELLDVVVVEPQLGLIPVARRYKARAVQIETDQPVDTTLDGELRSQTPVHIRVVPRALRVLVPDQTARSLIVDR